MTTQLKAKLQLLERLRQHDYHTYIHSINVAVTLVKFGRYLKLSSNELNQLEKIGLLHDIGKLYIDFEILNKASKLTNEEWEIIKKHPLYGHDILNEEEVEPIVKDAILEHHENMNGTGYPYQMKGENISFFGRMIRIVDSFDAMTSTRSYSNSKSHTEAKKEILQSVGILYDPFLAELFIAMLNDSH